jgi:biotin carboxylase
MKSLKGKKILILGGTAPCVHVTRFAKEMGAYVYVADEKTEKGPAKQIADEAVVISTNDYDSLLAFVKEQKIDGILTGPGEFNIVNAMTVSKMAGLPFYCNKSQWDICQDKRHFKDFCKQHGLPGVPEFSVDDVLTDKDFPVIVKPVDGCSSRGINVCHNQEEYAKAKEAALTASKTKKILVEKYVDNGGVTIDAKYVVVDGRFHLEAIGDRHVLNGGLITAISFYPSKYLDAFMSQVDPYVGKAFTSIGLNNGAFFFQAIPDGDKIYIYEMGLRVSGGMIYNMTEATSGNNTLKMLIHYGATGEMCEDEDESKINASFNGKVASTMAFPLRIGKIGLYTGFDEVAEYPGVIDLTRYYNAGDEILPKHVNTLDQLFARIMVSADNTKTLMSLLRRVREKTSVKNTDGEEMIIWDTFDSIYSHFESEQELI